MTSRAPLLPVLLALLVLSEGCSENWLERLRGGPEPAPTPSATPEPTPTPPPEEECNGFDDDGDGEVDEGFDDRDGDGVADCVDDACSLALTEPKPVEPVECGAPDLEAHDLWDVQVEWQWDGASGGFEPHVDALAVALLTDDNSDGLPSAGDRPAVVAATGWGPYGGQDHRGIVVLDGGTGVELWWPPLELDPWFSTWQVSAVDLDGDGWADLVGRRVGAGDDFPTVQDRQGVELWSAEGPRETEGLYEVAAVSEGSGLGLLVDDVVLDGANGAVLVDSGLADQCPDCFGHNPTPVDLDGDGVAEFAFGAQVLDQQGQVLWQAVRSASYTQWWVPLELDGDEEPELALLGEGWLDLYDGDGTLLHQAQTGHAYPFPPCAADLDGDGEVELAWAAKPEIATSASELSAWEIDGTKLWALPVVDGGWAACSAFDFDVNGAAELLFADEEAFYILDGATGEVLFVEHGHESATLTQAPIIADVDLDGSAEIVLGHSNGTEWDPDGWRGVSVLGHGASLWPGARPTWPLNNLRDYRFDDLGNFVGEPTTLAGDTNLLRARAPIPRDYPDLQIRVIDSCLSGCAEVSVMMVAVEVTNNGLVATEAEVVVELLLAEEPNPVRTASVPSLSAGAASSPVVFELPAAWVTAPLRLRVDGGWGGEAVVECDEGNNELVWTPPDMCP